MRAICSHLGRDYRRVISAKISTMNSEKVVTDTPEDEVGRRVVVGGVVVETFRPVGLVVPGVVVAPGVLADVPVLLDAGVLEGEVVRGAVVKGAVVLGGVVGGAVVLGIVVLGADVGGAVVLGAVSGSCIFLMRR